MKVIRYTNFTGKINESYLTGELHYYAFDWDDNLLHMTTVIHMDKLEDGEWIPVDVSTSEFTRVRNDKENYRVRNNNPDEAFAEFGDKGARKSKAFLIDVKNSLDNNKFAPSWDQFIQCLVSGSLFAIITARHHESKTLRKGVEMIINDYLNPEQKFEMYNNCLLHANFFTRQSIDSFDRIPKGVLTETELIKMYLDDCDFFGVSAKSFLKKFNLKATVASPEKAKELALNHFVDKCNSLGKSIGAKVVSVGFSDDDKKNVVHVDKFFREKTALSSGLMMKLSVYDTSDPTIKGGQRTRHISESSHRAPGMDSSVLPFSKWNSQAQWLHTNSKHPVDAYANKLHNQTKQAVDLGRFDDISTRGIPIRKRKKRSGK